MNLYCIQCAGLESVTSIPDGFVKEITEMFPKASLNVPLISGGGGESAAVSEKLFTMRPVISIGELDSIAPGEGDAGKVLHGIESLCGVFPNINSAICLINGPIFNDIMKYLVSSKHAAYANKYPDIGGKPLDVFAFDGNVPIVSTYRYLGDA